MGDEGKLYVPQDMVAVYREKVTTSPSIVKIFLMSEFLVVNYFLYSKI